MMLIIGSGAVITGIETGSLSIKDIDKFKRVVYCKQCGGALDFHALLLGKLDVRTHYAPGVLLIAGIALSVLVDQPFWAGFVLTIVSVAIVMFMCEGLDRTRLRRYRFSQSQAQELGGNPPETANPQPSKGYETKVYPLPD
jgi:hypothetical protein